MTELPEYERRKTGQDHGERDRQIAAITEIIGNLSQNVRRLEGRINYLTKKISQPKPDADTEEDPAAPAPWVWFPAPDVAQDDPTGGDNPEFTVSSFVDWYNATFVGTEGSRAKPIPACWTQHPGLSMEVAALAYSWRAANVGPAASIRDAQYWLHQWRPGFADRLVRDWVTADCVDGEHRPGGPPPRDSRFTTGRDGEPHSV